jgi:hypothetical protein
MIFDRSSEIIVNNNLVNEACIVCSTCREHGRGRDDVGCACSLQPPCFFDVDYDSNRPHYDPYAIYSMPSLAVSTYAPTLLSDSRSG